MVEVVRKTIGELFETVSGKSKYSLKYITEHSGIYPVYSAKTTGDMTKGYIDTYDYDLECLQITSNGANAGTVLYRANQKFSVGADTRIYLLNEEYKNNISVKFLYYMLKNHPEMQNFSWTNKASLYKLLDIAIDIPVTLDNHFDIKKQEEIVRKFELIEARKAELAEKIEIIKSVNVDIMSGETPKTTSIKVADLFDLTISTNTSKFTKTFVKENSGDIPVYGASSDNLPSYGYVKDNAVIVDKDGKREFPVRYFENCLTYNIEGLAGFIFYHEGRFSLSEKVRPLVIKEEYASKVNPLYLKQVLEPIFRSHVKGRKGENGKNEYTKLNTSMIKNLEVVLPLTSSGEIDLEKQNQIVKNSQTILEMKNNIEKQGYQFIQSNLDFNSNGVPYIYIYITLAELFDLKRGFSKYTKKYCLDNNGKYPVYSANNSVPLGYRNDFDFDGCYATISVNGIAGKITLIDNKFSLNADRMILIPKQEKTNIDYIAYILEPLLRQKVKGRSGENGRNEYTKIERNVILDTKIPVPFNRFGEIDLEIQKDIVEKIYKLKNIKTILGEEVKKLLQFELKF